MRIIINTYGRANEQKTFANLPPSVQQKTEFIVQHRERDLYPGKNIIVLPDEIRDLPSTRQWLVDNIQDTNVLIMDDDLSFAVRHDAIPTKLYKPTEQDLIDLFFTVEKRLKDYPIVGVSQREGNNRQLEQEVEVARCTGMFAFRTDIAREKNWRFDRTKTKEDMDFVLQCLNSGYKNLVLFNWVREAGISNAAGGCSTYRTKEMMDDDAHRFAALWPGIVKVVEKETKTSWGGGTRTDVTVYWKKCYANRKI